MPDPHDAVDVQNLRPKFKLCCKELAECTLCLVIDTELYIHPDNKIESEDHSGNDEEDYSNPKGDNGGCVKPTVIFLNFVCLNPITNPINQLYYSFCHPGSYWINFQESNWRDMLVIDNTYSSVIVKLLLLSNTEESVLSNSQLLKSMSWDVEKSLLENNKREYS